METLQFKTNINCGSCIEKVTPVLNADAQIHNWSVDTASPQKILTVSTNGNAEDVIKELAAIGYKAEQI